jgi:hypothetical protein
MGATIVAAAAAGKPPGSTGEAVTGQDKLAGADRAPRVVGVAAAEAGNATTEGTAGAAARSSPGRAATSGCFTHSRTGRDTALPLALVARHVYHPATSSNTAGTRNTGPVPPGTASSPRNHWKAGALEAVTSSTAGSPRLTPMSSAQRRNTTGGSCRKTGASPPPLAGDRIGLACENEPTPCGGWRSAGPLGGGARRGAPCGDRGRKTPPLPLPPGKGCDDRPAVATAAVRTARGLYICRLASAEVTCTCTPGGSRSPP